MCSVTQKGREINMKRKVFLRCIIGIFLAIVLIAGVCEQVQGDISRNIVRLHIVANSDKEADQTVKLAVRDAVLSMGKRMFPQGLKKELSYEQKELLTQAAEGVLRENGLRYGATLSVGKFYFPTKKYENITMPAGYYDAVKIVLGEGKGANWWCVMYPPLCFSQSAAGKISEENLRILKEEMGDVGYGAVTGEGVALVPSLKILEMWQGVKDMFVTKVK